MGVVYKAFDSQLRRNVALKLLRPDTTSADSHNRLLREAQATAKIKHRNVVAVYDVGGADSQVFLVMELVAGMNLRSWLRGGPRGWKDVLDVLIQAGEGLAAAHAAQLVHRDFKPENVMIEADGRVCVLDFGLARSAREAVIEHLGQGHQLPPGGRPDILLEELTRTGAVIGTPAYMSPEQLELADEVGPHSDQFSFAVTLFEAIYGYRPFAGSRFAELVVNITGGRIRDPVPERAPRKLWDILRKALATSPTRRYPTMVELLEDLRDIRRFGWLQWNVLRPLGVYTVVEAPMQLRLVTLLLWLGLFQTTRLFFWGFDSAAIIIAILAATLVGISLRARSGRILLQIFGAILLLLGLYDIFNMMVEDLSGLSEPGARARGEWTSRGLLRLVYGTLMLSAATQEEVVRRWFRVRSPGVK